MRCDLMKKKHKKAGQIFEGVFMWLILTQISFKFVQVFHIEFLRIKRQRARIGRHPAISFGITELILFEIKQSLATTSEN